MLSSLSFSFIAEASIFCVKLITSETNPPINQERVVALVNQLKNNPSDEGMIARLFEHMRLQSESSTEISNESPQIYAAKQALELVRSPSRGAQIIDEKIRSAFNSTYNAPELTALLAALARFSDPSRLSRFSEKFDQGFG